MKILSIKGATQVVPQTTLDYVPNLESLKPDLVVHGDDWKEGVQQDTCACVVEALSKWGEKLLEVLYTKGISSTAFHEAMKEVGTLNRLERIRAYASVEAIMDLRGEMETKGRADNFTGKIRHGLDELLSSSLK